MSWATNLLRSTFESEVYWFVECKETLILVTTVIASMSFQAAINPPGGVFQDVNTNYTDPVSPCTLYHRSDNSSTVICPGDSLLAIRNPQFFDFQFYNGLAFVSTFSLTLLLIAGFPARDKVAMWLTTIVLFLSLFSLGKSFSLTQIWLG